MDFVMAVKEFTSIVGMANLNAFSGAPSIIKENSENMLSHYQGREPSLKGKALYH